VIALHFLKMHGCGNDFILLDGMASEQFTLSSEEVRRLCHRNFGIGADGIIILKKSALADVEWDFFNSDGSTASMCGNGARCVFRYLFDHHFPHEKSLRLAAQSGIVHGRMTDDGMIEIQFLSRPPEGFSYSEKILAIENHPLTIYCIRAGIAHAVLEVKDLRSYPVSRIGKSVQDHATFQPEGTNVTFFQALGGNQILSTTFERGVAKETLACGTGAVAAAIIYSELYLQKFPIHVKLPGGNVIVDMTPTSQKVLLIGPAEYVAEVKVPVSLSTDSTSGKDAKKPGSTTDANGYGRGTHAV